jgi:hypothetical protein
MWILEPTMHAYPRGKGKENEMFKRASLLAVAAIVIYWTVAHTQQHPIVDVLSNKVIQKYQHSSCQELGQQKNEPKTPQEQKAVELLRNNPEVRAEFLNKVAAPIANKMFECGLIP